MVMDKRQSMDKKQSMGKKRSTHSGENLDITKMMKEAGILFTITLIAGLMLGFVYELTKEPIRIQEEKAVAQACQEVFPEAKEFQVLKYDPDEQLAEELAADGVKIGTVYNAVGADGVHMGYVLQSTSGEGYGGNITLYVGVTADGRLNGVSLLEISETPGLGMLAGDVLVPQFRNKQVESFTYTKTGSRDDSEIDAISGATVTTKAVIGAVNGGLRVAADLTVKLTEGGDGNE